MELNLLDHLLVLGLAVALPIWSVLDYHRLEASLRAGGTEARVRAYGRIMILEWSLLAAILGLWAFTGRGLPHLGLTFTTHTGAWVGAAAAVVVSAFLVGQLIYLGRDRKRLTDLLPTFESLRAMLPSSTRDSRWFMALSVTAGICEEVIYRGFLMAYFAELGVVLAVIASSIIFGLGHLYQGVRGFVKISVIGLVAAGLFVLTGSLWAPIVLHIVLDVTSGLLARRVLLASEEEEMGTGTPIAV